MFPFLNKINELVKDYHIFNSFDKVTAKQKLSQIYSLLLKAATDAEQRQIFFDQYNINANTGGYPDDYYISRDDINYLIEKGVAVLEQNATVSLTHQGIRKNVLTRENVSWQQLFSNIQGGGVGQYIPFSLPEEIYFQKNEALQITIANQTSAGFLFVHGCNLKDDYSPNVDDLKAEIESKDDEDAKIPQTQLVPLIYKFNSNAVDAVAVDLSNKPNIFTQKNEKSVLLTHVGTSSSDVRITLEDTGRNQQMCEVVEMQGIAANYLNQYTGFYPLPYPHLLRSGDRLKARILNGSLINNNEMAADTLYYTVFRGITLG